MDMDKEFMKLWTIANKEWKKRYIELMIGINAVDVDEKNDRVNITCGGETSQMTLHFTMDSRLVGISGTEPTKVAQSGDEQFN